MSQILNSQSNINEITQNLIGKTCHQVRFSYGDELILDCGTMTPYNHPKLKHLYKGEWQFSTRAIPCYLMLGYQILFWS